MPDHPLIVTLKLDEAAQVYFNQLRQQYFPKHVNYLDAHLTLFHHLPASFVGIDEALKHISNRNNMQLNVSGLKNMGNGVAFWIESAELQQLHKKLQQSFASFLISQDRQNLWPHITVQNKVTAFKAAQTLDFLQRDFKPSNIYATGISTWLYMSGPWAHQQDYPFLNTG